MKKIDLIKSYVDYLSWEYPLHLKLSFKHQSVKKQWLKPALLALAVSAVAATALALAVGSAAALIGVPLLFVAVAITAHSIQSFKVFKNYQRFPNKLNKKVL